MLPDEEIAALDLLMVKFMEVWFAEQADKATKAAVDARLEGYPAQFRNFYAAFAVFGFNPEKDGWGPIRKGMGEEAYARSLAKFGRVPEVLPDDEVQPAELPKIENVEPSDEAGAPIRELVLRRLKAAPGGLKASELREQIETLRKAALHEKTIGMTLYRLSQDKQARRDGRTWFYVPPSGETKNPGGETPGPINRDGKKGEEL